MNIDVISISDYLPSFDKDCLSFAKHQFPKYCIIWFVLQYENLCGSKSFTPFSFYKQSIFDPRPENCLSFSKKSPKKLFSNCLVDGLLTSIVLKSRDTREPFH